MVIVKIIKISHLKGHISQKNHVLKIIFMQKWTLQCCCPCTEFSSSCYIIFIFSCIFSSPFWRTFLRNTLYIQDKGKGTGNVMRLHALHAVTAPKYDHWLFEEITKVKRGVKVDCYSIWYIVQQPLVATDPYKKRHLFVSLTKYSHLIRIQKTMRVSESSFKELQMYSNLVSVAQFV